MSPGDEPSYSEVRHNPILGLPSWRRLRRLPPRARRELSRVLEELRADADARAERSWKFRHAPMAAYWRAVAVYSRHLGRALRRSRIVRP